MELTEMVKGLIESRAKAWEEAKHLNDEVAEAERQFSGEEQETWDRIMADMDAKDARIKELTELDERNKAADEARAKFESAVRPAGEGRNEGNPEEEALRAFLSGERRSVEFRLTGADKEAVNE